MNDYDLTERERFLRQAEWDVFSQEHRTDLQTTFTRHVAKEAFVAAFEAGLKHGRELARNGGESG